MFELKVLSAAAESRSDYDEVKLHIDRSTLSPIGLVVLDALEQYYSSDKEALEVDKEILTRRVEREFSTVPKHLDMCKDYLQKLWMIDTSAINVMTEILDARLHSVGLALADELMRNGDNKDALLDEYDRLRSSESLEVEIEEEYSGVTVDDLSEFFSSENKIQIAPAMLNEKLKGGLKRGHHMLVAARPEAGKSLIALNMAGGFVRQGLKVLYVGNEDPIPDLIMRFLTNLTGMEEDEVLADGAKAMELAESNGYSLCVFVGMAPGSAKAIDAAARRHKPDVIIVDQLRNLSINSENNTTRLDAVARAVRALGRKHNAAVISVTQVGDSGDGKLVLQMGDIDSSNTGIPGACDVMVMIGMDEEYDKHNWRMVSLPKNKAGGWHGNFTVVIDPLLTRVLSSSAPAVPKFQEAV